MKYADHLRCVCGGVVEITTEVEYGRAIERCQGTCGYEGAPRPAMDAPSYTSRTIRTAARPLALCCEPDCQTLVYGPKAIRCWEHAEARHNHQRTPEERQRQMSARLARHDGMGAATL